MKKLICLMLTLVLALSLAACGCDHEWKNADCENPITCSLCGKTEGEALGHSWEDANCESPKTCSACGETEGEALGHSWGDANCENPMTCSVCGATEGEALGHDWKDATTEEPKTCATCGATEGERIITDARFHTADCEAVFGSWEYVIAVDGSMMGIEEFEGTVDIRCVFTFNADGTMNTHFSLADEAAYMEALADYTVKLMYAEFAALGLSAEEADATMKQAYGMSISEYVEATVAAMDISELYEEVDENYVYYVSGDVIYSADNWDAAMEENPFRLEDGKLVLFGASVEAMNLGVSEMSLSRVS